MAENCIFPLCPRVAVDKGLCISHRMYDGMVPAKKAAAPDDHRPHSKNIKKEVKAKKKIAPRSKKLKEEMKEYKPQVKAYLARPENHKCLINSPVCTNDATCVNHKKRRGANLRNEKYFQPSCGPCNNYIEANTQWALDNGHLIPVHHKTKQADA